MSTTQTTLKVKILSALLFFFCISILLPTPVSADTSSKLQEQKIRLERILTQIQGQTKTSLINKSSLVEIMSSTKLAKAAGSKLSGKTVKKGVQGDVVEDLRYMKGQVWWKVKFSTTSVGWLPEKKLKRIPSTLLNIDTNDDGIPDSNVRFVGEYNSGFFGFKHVEGDTVVKYFKTKEDAARAGYTIIQRRIQPF